MAALTVPDGSPFLLTNLPYGVGAPAGEPPRVVVAVGTQALDLAALAVGGLLDGALDDPAHICTAPALNPLLALGPAAWLGLRNRLRELVTDPASAGRIEPALLPQDRL